MQQLGEEDIQFEQMTDKPRPLNIREVKVGFGFLGKKIFISGKLIQEEGLVDGMTCRALVTPSYNRKKKEWGLATCRILSKGQPD